MRGRDRGAAVTDRYSHAITLTSPLPEQPLDQGRSLSNREEWEIVGRAVAPLFPRMWGELTEKTRRALRKG